MTMLFDEKARKNLINSFNKSDYEYNGIPIKDMTIKRVNCNFARPYIATFHYSKTMPDSSKFIYAGYLGDKLCGIVVYGMGCGKNQYTHIIPDIKNGEYVELTRLWCPNDMPKNTESRLIALSLKVLPDEIKLVLSFADDSKRHCGIIYQATNWYYIGKNKGGKMLLTSDGIEKHPRLLGIYRKRHPEYKDYTSEQLRNLLNYKVIDGGVKHKYVYLRGKDRKKYYKKYIEGCELPYPKCDKGELKSEVDIVNDFAN